MRLFSYNQIISNAFSIILLMKSFANSSSIIKIVVIDKDASDAFMFSEALSDIGMIFYCNDLSDAWHTISENKPDIVLMAQTADVDAFETCAKIKSKSDCEYLPIILKASKTDAGNVEQWLAAGAVDVIEQPINSLIAKSRVKAQLALKLRNDGLRSSVADCGEGERGLREGCALAGLAAHMPCLIYQFRLYPDGRTCCPFVSAMASSVLGLSPDQLCEDAGFLLDFYHEDDRAMILDSIQESANTMQPWIQEFRAVLPGLGTRWLMGHSIPEKLSDGSILWHGYISDITERKEAEERKRRLRAMYHALSQTNEAILHVQDIHDFFQRICEIAVGCGGMALSWIGLPGDNQCLVPVASHGKGIGFLHEIAERGGFPVDMPDFMLGRSAVGIAYRSGETVVIDDVSQDERVSTWAAISESYGIRSVAAFPILRANRPYAVMAVNSDMANAFDGQIVQLLKEMSANISFALDSFDREAARRQRDAEISAIFEGANEGIFIADKQGRCIDVNECGARMLGYSKEEMLDLSISNIVIKAENPRIKSEIANWDENVPTLTEWHCLRKDGSTFVGEVSTHLLPDCRVMGIMRDITERRKAEAALRQSKSFRTAILNSLLEHIAVIDQNGIILSINRSWLDFAAENGASGLEEDWIGRNYLDAYRNSDTEPDGEDADTAIAGINQVLSGERVCFSTEYACHSPTRRRWFVMRVTSLQNTRGSAVISHENITARKLIEIEIDRSRQRLAELSTQLIETQEQERKELAMELHDELGQRFTVLNMHLHYLHRFLADNEAEAVWREATSEIDGLMQQVRTMSGNLRPPTLDHLGLEASVRQLLKQQFSSSSVDFSFKYTGLPQKLAPQTEIALYRVIQEAITNISRHAEATTVAVEIRRKAKASQIRLAINDNGKGFDLTESPASQQRRRSYGLVGMQERIRLLGGILRFESDGRSGTTIEATLPLSNSK